jgi:hypothetical protein
LWRVTEHLWRKLDDDIVVGIMGSGCCGVIEVEGDIVVGVVWKG